MKRDRLDRRTVLRLTGIGLAGGTALSGTASADGKPLPRTAPDGRTIYGTWGDHEVWEIFDAEPPDRWLDDEGNDSAHEPLYFIRGLPTAENEHSPQVPLPPTFPIDGIDHVVPVPGGTTNQYSAQWHPKAVVDPEDPLLIPPGPDSPGFPNLVNTDGDGNYLTSDARIEAALAAGDVGVLVAPEEAVFTCPVRPHGSGGH